MSAQKRWFWLFVALAAIPIVAQATIQLQRAQIGVAITINVTPAPVSMTGPTRASRTSGSGIVARLVLGPSERSGAPVAQNLSFVSGTLVAQSAAQQKAVKVEAEVSPNPSGTLLTSNQTGIQVSQTAGTTQTYACLYTVSVSTTVTNWALYQGLYTDFFAASGTEIAGGNVANNTYLSTPLPAYTPFAVYSDDGNQWTLLQDNGGVKTYCVSLQVTIPVSTGGGAYSSQAIYTLKY